MSTKRNGSSKRASPPPHPPKNTTNCGAILTHAYFTGTIVSTLPINYTKIYHSSPFTFSRPLFDETLDSGALLSRKIELRYFNKGLFLSSISTRRPFENSRARADRSPRPFVAENYLHSAGSEFIIESLFSF